MNVTFPLMAVSRLRMLTDGEGVTTLVAAGGCPLRCKYCLNPQSLEAPKVRPVTPQTLYDAVKIDDLYFRATGGGVVFGGGEPLNHPKFIAEFRKLCGDSWRLLAETSLNVPAENVAIAAEVIDEFIVDIKDMDPDIYHRYTGQDNARVKANLRQLVDRIGPERILVRVPLIPDYNTDADRDRSVAALTAMGLTRFDRFEYTLRHMAEKNR